MTDINAPSLPVEIEPKGITREHIRQMFTVAQSPRDQALLLFFRDSGCRTLEALALTWGDINFDEGVAISRGKGDKGRQLFFGSSTSQALKAYRQICPYNKEKQPVWWGKKGPLSYNGLYKIFKRLAEDAGLADDVFNPHSWRHAFGRDTTKAGIPTAQLQDLMGHSNIKVTKIYAQFNIKELKDAHTRYSPVEDDLRNMTDPNNT